MSSDLAKQKFMKTFLKDNPWFVLVQDKLRRINDGVRRPCLVNPETDHGTDNMSINNYNGVYYLQCFQQPGKYLIPGQKNAERQRQKEERIREKEREKLRQMNEKQREKEEKEKKQCLVMWAKFGFEIPE